VVNKALCGQRRRGTVFSEECGFSGGKSGEPQGPAVPPTGSCCLALHTALPLLVRMLSASLDFSATGLAVVVAAGSLSVSALSNGWAFEGEGGSRPGAGRVGAHPTQCRCIEEKSCRTARGLWGQLSLVGVSACASGNKGANGPWSPASK